VNARLDTSDHGLSHPFRGPRAVANGWTGINYALVKCLVFAVRTEYTTAAVPKMCSADPSDPRPVPTCFFIKRIRFCWNDCKASLIGIVFISYLIKQPPVPTKRATFSLIKVQSCNAFFSMLLVCVRSHLKWVLRRKFLILNSLYLREQECEDTWLFFEAKRSASKKVGKHCTRVFKCAHRQKSEGLRSDTHGSCTSRTVCGRFIAMNFLRCFGAENSVLKIVQGF
jgi:hypothetical protein